MKKNSGQTLLEYLILLALISISAVLVLRGLQVLGIQSWFQNGPLQDLQYMYKYGHKDARGADEAQSAGGFPKHIRVQGRILTPRAQ